MERRQAALVQSDYIYFWFKTNFLIEQTRLGWLGRPAVPKDKQSCTFINYLTQTNKTFNDNSNWSTDNIQTFYAFKEFLCYLWPASILPPLTVIDGS